jgi:hypothetical protein
MGDDVHQWVSFDYDDETWLFDVTFLMSNWRCIWDAGCPGIRSTPTPEQAQGCCSFGAHFSDDADLERVRAAAARLTAEDWQHEGVATEIVERDDDGEARTALVDDGCVFLNRPGFPGGHGCALHRAALRTGEPITQWKPEVCWQLPLRLEHHEDDNGHVVNVLREWRRRDWGEGGQDLHWWCTEDDRAFIGREPVHQYLRHEIQTLLGDDLTAMLLRHLATQSSEHLLPHPAVRRP